MALPPGIEINPKIMLGKPVIRGTRIPVELILRKLAEGATEHDLLDAHLNLKDESCDFAAVRALRAAGARSKLAERVLELIRTHPERLPGSFVVLQLDRIRISALPAREPRESETESGKDNG